MQKSLQKCQKVCKNAKKLAKMSTFFSAILKVFDKKIL